MKVYRYLLAILYLILYNHGRVWKATVFLSFYVLCQHGRCKHGPCRWRRHRQWDQWHQPETKGWGAGISIRIYTPPDGCHMMPFACVRALMTFCDFGCSMPTCDCSTWRLTKGLRMHTWRLGGRIFEKTKWSKKIMRSYGHRKPSKQLCMSLNEEHMHVWWTYIYILLKETLLPKEQVEPLQPSDHWPAFLVRRSPPQCHLGQEETIPSESLDPRIRWDWLCEMINWLT